MFCKLKIYFYQNIFFDVKKSESLNGGGYFLDGFMIGYERPDEEVWPILLVSQRRLTNYEIYI